MPDTTRPEPVILQLGQSAAGKRPVLGDQASVTQSSRGRWVLRLGQAGKNRGSWARIRGVTQASHLQDRRLSSP